MLQIENTPLLTLLATANYFDFFHILVLSFAYRKCLKQRNELSSRPILSLPLGLHRRSFSLAPKAGYLATALLTLAAADALNRTIVWYENNVADAVNKIYSLLSLDLRTYNLAYVAVDLVIFGIVFVGDLRTGFMCRTLVIAMLVLVLPLLLALNEMVLTSTDYKCLYPF